MSGSFKKALSYLYPLVLDRSAGNLDHELEVRLENGVVVLNSRTANYSFGKLHRVWRKALAKVKIQHDDKVLVLGAGAGSLKKIIHEEMCIDARLTMVESDQAVLDLGKKYFEFADGPNVNIVLADAFHFCGSTKDHYDLVLIDLFIDMDLPDKLLMIEFWENLERISRSGCIILNTIIHNKESLIKVSELRDLLSERYSQIKEYKMLGINHLIFIECGIYSPRSTK